MLIDKTFPRHINREQAWLLMPADDNCSRALLEAAGQGALGRACLLLDEAAAWVEGKPTRSADLETARDMLACAELTAFGSLTPGRLLELLRRFDKHARVPTGLPPLTSSLDPTTWRAFVRKALEGLQWPQSTTALANGREQSLAWAWDLFLHFTGTPRKASATEAITALLVVGRTPHEFGKTALLSFEMLGSTSADAGSDGEEGTGRFYPDPTTMSFLSRDNAFRAAEQEATLWAKRQGLWPGATPAGEHAYTGGCDVRWRLVRQDGEPIPAVAGGSMGAAFGLGLAKLFAATPRQEPDDPLRTSLKNLSLLGVAATAQLKADGTLETIAGAFEKLLEAARQKSLPRVNTVLVADGQRVGTGLPLESQGLVKDPLNPKILTDPTADFHVVQASTLLEGVERLVLDTAGRWGEIRDFSDELRRHRNLVGREWLRQRVDSWVQRTTAGYLLIQAAPGIGKTAFTAEAVQRRGTVFHLIKRGMGDWDEPDVILGSLTAQLRRKYALLPTDSEKSMTPGGAFNSTLQRVSKELEPGQKEVVYLDGLDEAFGPTGRFSRVALPGVLPQVLPEGVLLVLSSRPGEFLSWLADPRLCEPADLTGNEPENLADIGAYLRQQDESRGLGLGDSLLQSLVRASEGSFAVAVKYVEARPGLEAELTAWRADPAAVPVGLARWLNEQWQRLARASAASNISPDVMKAVLAVLASALMPLSREQLQVFLALAPRQSPPGRTAPAVGFLDVVELGRHSMEVVGLARELFDTLDPALGAQAPYRFFHTRFQEFILNQLSTLERQDSDRLLARGCAAVVADDRVQGPSRDYALRYRMKHLIAAGQWREVAETFGDAAYAVERSLRLGPGFGFAAVYADAQAAEARSRRSAEWHEAFAAWERFLRFRLDRRLSLHPEMYAQEVSNEFSPGAGGVLAAPLQPLRRAARGDLRLTKRHGPAAITGVGHSAPVTSVGFSPDGERVVSGSHDGTAKVWDSRTGTLLADCRGHEHRTWVWSVGFSPDGERVVSGGHDWTAKVWDSRSGRLLADCRGHRGRVTSVSFSPDGERVVSGSHDGTAKVWDSRSGRLLADCRGHDDEWVMNARFSPDGERVVSGSDDQTLKVWETSSGRLLADCRGHEGQVRSVGFSPGGERMVSGSHDGTAKVWDSRTGTLLADCRGHEHRTWVWSVGFSPDGERVVSGGHDWTAKVWDSRSGRLLADCRGHRNPVTSVSFSADGERIVSGSDDGTAKVWDSRSGHMLADCRGHRDSVTSVSFSPDGESIVSGSHDGTAKVWDTRSGHLLADCRGHDGTVTSVEFPPEGKRLVSGSADSTVKARGRGNVEAAWCVALSADGERLVQGSLDGRVKVRERRSGKLLAEWRGHEERVFCVAFSLDGKRVASGAYDGTVKVSERRGGKLLAHCRSHYGSVYGVGFSLDGERLVSGSYDSTVRVWESRSGRLLALCLGHKGWIQSVAFCPDNERVVSGSRDRTVKVWESRSGRLLADCRGDMGAVRSVAFSPGGERVVSGCEDGTVKVWDSRSGRLVADCRGHKSGVWSVVFSPDGERVVSGSDDGTVTIWAVAAAGLKATGPEGRPEARCDNVLFYERPVLAVGFSTKDSRLLLVLNDYSRAFAYSLVNGPAGVGGGEQPDNPGGWLYSRAALRRLGGWVSRVASRIGRGLEHD